MNQDKIHSKCPALAQLSLIKAKPSDSVSMISIHLMSHVKKRHYKGSTCDSLCGRIESEETAMSTCMAKVMTNGLCRC